MDYRKKRAIIAAGMKTQKVKTLKELEEIRKKFRTQGVKTVLTNGCFDLLHRGHIHLLREAKKLGDVLIVAVNDDSSVRRLKGISRPVFPLAQRLEILESIEFIDFLLSFGEDTPQMVVERLLPDVLVKGGDWKPDEVVGKKEVEKFGGKVVVIPTLKGYSTSGLIERISAAAFKRRKNE
jgi:D-beta-D-heptose 7-phosphate kinase/D-beta-D-heptose 1-phosphate adenosyltransferase